MVLLSRWVAHVSELWNTFLCKQMSLGRHHRLTASPLYSFFCFICLLNRTCKHFGDGILFYFKYIQYWSQGTPNSILIVMYIDTHTQTHTQLMLFYFVKKFNKCMKTVCKLIGEKMFQYSHSTKCFAR